MKLTEDYRINRNSSKGNQLKWQKDGVWYKADYLGYEGLSEYLVSALLQKTNIANYVTYAPVVVDYNNHQYNGCSSDNFLKEGCSIITLDKLFQKYLEVDVSKESSKFEETEDRIRYVVDNVVAITGLQDFGKYLSIMLEIDAFFLNEDRHFNNIAVIYDSQNGHFEYCPIFDNGAALFSDTTISYPLSSTLEQCYDEIEAMPFERSFIEQLDAGWKLYGGGFRHNITKKDVEELLSDASVQSMYSTQVTERMQNVLFEQMRVYGGSGMRMPNNKS